MAVSRENLTAWLRDAHAMENQAIEILEKQASRLEHYPELRAKVSSHLDESHRQAERVERCLHQLGTDTSGLKTALGKMVGTAQQLSGLFASDEVLKSGIADYAFEHYEIASYKISSQPPRRRASPRWGAYSKRTCAKRKKWLRGWRSICRRSRASTCTAKQPGRPRKSDGPDRLQANSRAPRMSSGWLSERAKEHPVVISNRADCSTILGDGAKPMQIKEIMTRSRW